MLPAIVLLKKTSEEIYKAPSLSSPTPVITMSTQLHGPISQFHLSSSSSFTIFIQELTRHPTHL
jgi:hypothetical protein